MTKEGRRWIAGRRGIPRPVRKRRTGRAADMAACTALRYRARSPAGVPPRHLRQRPNATAQLQFTRFLGTGPLRDGCYPSPAAPVQRVLTRRPVVVPAGRFGPEPPEREGDSPTRGNRTRPLPPASPGSVLPGARFDSLSVSISGTNVKLSVTTRPLPAPQLGPEFPRYCDVTATAGERGTCYDRDDPQAFHRTARS